LGVVGLLGARLLGIGIEFKPNLVLESESNLDPVLEPKLKLEFSKIKFFLKKKSLELGVNRQLTTGFRPSYLEPELGLISRTGI